MDLPGYGFAKVSKKTQKDWGILMHQYFSSNARYALSCSCRCIFGVMHLMCVTDLSLLVSFSRCLDEDEKHLFSSEFLRVLPETSFLRMIEPCAHFSSLENLKMLDNYYLKTEIEFLLTIFVPFILDSLQL